MDTLFVLLGVRGDLSKKKLIPALYNIIDKGKNLIIAGVSRTNCSAKDILNESKQFIKNIDEVTWKKLEDSFYYIPTDLTFENDVLNLGDKLKEIELTHKTKNRVFYLATSPEQFSDAISNLNKHSLTKSKGYSRIIFEKPFGTDLNSALKINTRIKSMFKEDQVYRIDHYLGKEIVKNISVLRFNNIILEPIWNEKFIDHIQIILSEDFGVEDRGKFYDSIGAFKDVIQNHLLQLVSLIGMEKPKDLNPNNLREEKVKVLKNTKIVDSKFAQFENYGKEPNVFTKSKTETACAVKLNINTKRWKNIPFYLLTGKFFPKKTAKIFIQFKQPKCISTDKQCNFEPNSLSIEIQPNTGFYLQLNAKDPETNNVIPINFDFCHVCNFGLKTKEAYESLLLDVFNGDQSLFVRNDEIELQWKIVDKIKPKISEIYKKETLPNSFVKFIQDKKLNKQNQRVWKL